jgi:hypothetical protein
MLIGFDSVLSHCSVDFGDSGKIEMEQDEPVARFLAMKKSS